jgi:hypothetical protein
VRRPLGSGPDPHLLVNDGFHQHPDKHRPERPILLAVDQELGEGTRRGVAQVGADRVDPLEVGEHEDVKQLGAGGWA